MLSQDCPLHSQLHVSNLLIAACYWDFSTLCCHTHWNVRVTKGHVWYPYWSLSPACLCRGQLPDCSETRGAVGQNISGPQRVSCLSKSGLYCTTCIKMPTSGMKQETMKAAFCRDTPSELTLGQWWWMLLLQPETIEFNRMMYCQSFNGDKVIFLDVRGRDHCQMWICMCACYTSVSPAYIFIISTL